jgi:hypothetical protein
MALMSPIGWGFECNRLWLLKKGCSEELLVLCSSVQGRKVFLRADD